VEADVVPLYSEPLTRRRRSIRPLHAAPERRKKKSSGFDVAAALEPHLDRFPTKELLWHVLVGWLDAAKREKLAERLLDSGEWWEDNVAWTRKLPSDSYSGHWRSLQ
jgi:hypothetical protein